MNSFAYNVVQNNITTFHSVLPRGWNVSGDEKGTVLFIGDSLMQQYIPAIINKMSLKPVDIDSVTRGGCVLLKGVNYKDKFSDISCSDLRRKLYQSRKKYKKVIISQNWQAYDQSILNSSVLAQNKNFTELKWLEFLEMTINHFDKLSEEIIIVGAHPEVSGTKELQPNLLLTKK